MVGSLRGGAEKTAGSKSNFPPLSDHLKTCSCKIGHKEVLLGGDGGARESVGLGDWVTNHWVSG